MKRTQLIEWGIVTIGLIFGYKLLDSFLSLIAQIAFSIQGAGDISNVLFNGIFLVAIYTVSFVLLIRRSRQIAIYISGMAADETVPLKIGKRSLLQVVLIGVCIVTILSNVAEILLYLFEAFKQEAGRRSLYDDNGNKVSNYAFKIAAIQAIVAGVTLYFSKEISGWFIKKNEADELIFDSNPEN